MAQKIQFQTDDGVQISSAWTTAPTTIGAAILVHSYPLTKESWAVFQRVLAKRGIASLAIDLRGHGESNKTVDGGTLDYRSFSNEEHLSSISDIGAAYSWIRKRGIDRERIVLFGSSIGANLCLRFLADEPTIPAAILLSPGKTYHGIESFDAADAIAPHQSIYLLASSEDDDDSVEACVELERRLEVSKKVFKKLKQAGHGISMLEGDEALMAEIADWSADCIQNFAY